MGEFKMRGFCPLASGSSGNSVYLGTKKAKVLFDAGVSFKVLKERLEAIDVGIEEIDAIIVSHEHADHIKAIAMVAKKTDIPIFCNSDTARAISHLIDERPKFKIFSTGETFTFADLEIHPFSIQHDTVDPVAFTVKFEDKKLGVCTDLGFVTKIVETNLRDCDWLYLEANHDEELVHACGRPILYKQRVLSRQGHISNKAAGKLIAAVHSKKLKHVYLAHLSSECNNPEIAFKTVSDILIKEEIHVELSIAKPHEVSKPILFESTEKTS